MDKKTTLAFFLASACFFSHSQTTEQARKTDRMQILLQEQKNISQRLAEAIVKKATAANETEAEKTVNRFREDLKSINSEINHENNVKTEAKIRPKPAQAIETRPAAQATQSEEKKEPLVQAPVKIEAPKEYKPWDIFKQI